MGPRKGERLRGLLRRSDAFNNALAALEGEEGVSEGLSEYVEVLRAEHERAREAFRLYRAEVGVPSPKDREPA